MSQVNPQPLKDILILSTYKGSRLPSLHDHLDPLSSNRKRKKGSEKNVGDNNDPSNSLHDKGYGEDIKSEYCIY